MKIIKKLMYGLLLAGACVLGSASSFAQEAPQILWDKQAIDGVEYRGDITGENGTLCNKEALIDIGKLLDARLEYLRSAGKLPFKTLVIDSFQNNDVQSKMAQEEYIALVPVVTSDLCKVKRIVYNNTAYYSYTVRAELNVLFCTFDGLNLKILYNLPLANQAVLGGGVEDALNYQLDEDFLRKQFVYNVEQLIDEVEFPKQLNKQFTNSYLPTYQVNDVLIPETVYPILQKKLNSANYSEKDKQEFKAVIASSFTNQYATKYRDRIVLPSTMSGTKWKKALVQHLSPSLNIAEYDSTQDEGNFPIKINVANLDVRFGELNQYSIMRDVEAVTDLKADDGKNIFSAQAITRTSIPKGWQVSGEILNPIEVFNDAALELGNSIKAK